VLELTPELVGPSITKNQGIIGEGVDLTVSIWATCALHHPVPPDQHLLYTSTATPARSRSCTCSASSSASRASGSTAAI
jgi:hypothetical protein